MGSRTSVHSSFRRQDSERQSAAGNQRDHLSRRLRLKIPLASLKSVVARDGELHLKWPEGSAVFEIGDHAEKWAHKILHPKSTAEKLGIKPGLVISALGMADGNFVKDLRATAESFSDTKALNNSDLIFFGAEKAARTRSRRKAGFHRSPARARCGSSIPKASRRSRNCR